MSQKFAYKALLISNSQEVKIKFSGFCEDRNINSYILDSTLGGLEFLKTTSVDSILIDTSISEDEIVSFLNNISSDTENQSTPVIIISQTKDCNRLADLVSEFNVISILSNTNWQIQASKLLGCFKTKKINVHFLENNLIQSEDRSVIDHLTGAYNRYGADDIFKRLTSRYKSFDENFCMVMLDIDHFKSVNDNHGHNIGDEVLIDISKLIMKSIRKDDSLVRFGGEEFVILISNIDINIAIRNSENLREMIDVTAHSSSHLDITASFGVIQYIKDEDLKSMLKRADKLLYKAKNAGRNRVEFLNG